MAETSTTPTKKPAARNRRRTPPPNARNRAHKPSTNAQTSTQGETEWSSERPLPLAVALRGFNQIVGRFCGKYPDRGIDAPIDEAMAYARQLRQQAHGQKVMTAGAAA